MRDVIAAELFKTLRRRMTYILLFTLVFLVALFYFILWLRVRQGPEPRLRGLVQYQQLLNSMAFENVVPYGLGLVRTFGTLIAVIFAGVMIGNEFDWGTAALAVSRGVRRWHFIVAKMVVSLGFVVVAVQLGFLVALIGSAWLSHVYGLSYGDADLGRIGQTLASEGRTMFVILPFLFMAMLFATIWRSAGQAVGFSLGFFFLEGIFTALLTNATGLIEHIPEALLNLNVSAVMDQNGSLGGGLFGGGAPEDAGGPPAWRAASILLAYVVAFVVLAIWRFRRRDLVQ